MAESNELSLALFPDMDQLHPQAYYAKRATRPPEFLADGSGVQLNRMADILAVNLHKGVIAKAPGSPPTLGGVRPLIPLDLDGTEQVKYRKLLDPLFAPKRVALLEPRVRQLADSLIDGFVDRGEVELFEAFCQPIPSTIFISMLGLPVSELDYFLRFKDYAIRAPGETIEEQVANRDQAGRDMADRLLRELEQRRRSGQPGDDLIGGFMVTEVDGHRLSDEDIIDICYLLVIAGLDTVAASLSCIFNWLAEHPEEQQRLHADSALLPAAIEELMRFESPVMFGSRYAAEDITINGIAIPQGTNLMVSWSSANMDPTVFVDPETVDLERPKNKHIAFASGFHRCLGSHLARLELRVAIDQFHKRIAKYWIKEGAESSVHNLGVRTFERLPLSFEASPRGG